MTLANNHPLLQIELEREFAGALSWTACAGGPPRAKQ
jgi:hypothetical protein